MCGNEPAEVSAFCEEIRSLALKAEPSKSHLYIAICDAINRLEDMISEQSKYADSLIDLLKMAVGESNEHTYDHIFTAIDTHEERRRKSVV